MALTFRALVEQADFSRPTEDVEQEEEVGGEDTGANADRRQVLSKTLTLRHDVHVHLPVSDDIKVYDAIFRSIRDNLLS
jgi:hypothetical protein